MRTGRKLTLLASWARILLLSLSAMPTAAAATEGLVNTNLIRTITLTGLPYVSEQIGVVVQNTDSATQTAYSIRVPQAKLQHLAEISVHERKSGHALALHGPEYLDASNATAVYRAQLRAGGLRTGEKVGLNVDMVFTKGVEPRPDALAYQSDDQVWLWQDAVAVDSEYPTRKQKTVVKTRGGVRHAEAPEGVSVTQNSRSVTFGPFNAVPEEPSALGSVSFVDNAEQLEAMTQVREYFVSHWAGTLHVDDDTRVQSLSPRLEQFDRVQMAMGRYLSARDNLVKAMFVWVPQDANEFYFVDQIGNVSTSALGTATEGYRLLQLRPRYPLAGQWTYAWRHGYQLPLRKYLKRSNAQGSNSYSLRVPLIDPIAASALSSSQVTVDMASAQNTAVSSYELRVTLPEGAQNVRVHMPAGSVESADSVQVKRTAWYLDSVGRPQVVIERRNVAPSLYEMHVVVSYDMPAWALWVKPVAVAMAVLAMFALASLVGRMQFGLNKKQAKSKKE
ncbi:dolichyl-diphosphooligosaccharide--protein glycosyltransferase subunit 1 [Coemansia sp. Benny D115]|nr:dolichyl-diphosphooligosaccharide--protein glycosyltransferase subunit 1 [Coemansia sp. Benny D115]